jgi:hypothetical protein
MYQIRFEGGVGAAEQAAITAVVPERLNKVIKDAVSVGDQLIDRWFGSAARTGTTAKAFDEKRRKMDDYLNRRCSVLTFVKKPYDATVDEAKVVQGDFAQVIRSCFRDDPGGFVPSGLRIYVLGTGMIDQKPDEMFNTIAHEVTHRVMGTTDFVYGINPALRLARTQPEKAVNCAENWGYFYMELKQRIA